MLSKLKRIKTRCRLIKDSRIRIGEKTQLRDDFRWEIRERTKQIEPITIGHDCIIGGTHIIEDKNGSITIGNYSTIGSGTLLVAANADIQIGNHVVISFNVTIYNTNAHSLNYLERRNDVEQTIAVMRGEKDYRNIHWDSIHSSNVVIEDDVWIGFGATILKGVTIGQGAIIGAKSVVTHDVEPFTVVAGNPSKPIKYLLNNEVDMCILK